MFCPKCGTQMPDDAEFCTKCGIKLPAGNAVQRSDSTQTDAPKNEDEKSSPLITIIAIVVIIVFVIVLLRPIYW